MCNDMTKVGNTITIGENSLNAIKIDEGKVSILSR